MNESVISKFLELSSTYLLAGGSAIAAAQAAVTKTETVTKTLPPARPRMSFNSHKLASDFAVFAGSEANAASLVNGLWYGRLITLNAITTDNAATGTPSSGSIAFMPPTRPMGWDNVRHTLMLAERGLAVQGIANPTPDQLQAALIGGSVINASSRTTVLPGVLTLRSQGLGWGQIAHLLGVLMGSATLKHASHKKPAVTSRERHVGAFIRSAGWSGDGGVHARSNTG